MTTTNYSIPTAAMTAYDAGLSILPPRQDGSKQPSDDSWKQRAVSRLPRFIAERMFAPERYNGLGIFTGTVFANGSETEREPYGVECFEFDDAAAYAAFLTDAETDPVMRELVERIRNGYEEQTPSGGIHWLYFCETVEGNTKLAQRPNKPDEQETRDDKVKTLVETRGVGGYVVTAPSNGTVHKSGKPYVLRRGGFDSIATITRDEREALFTLARRYDQMPSKHRHERQERKQARTGKKRPGDAFNERGNWAEILTPHGWNEQRTSGRITYWLRPGAKSTDTNAKDATTNADGSDRMFVHSTSAYPFEANRYYDKFSAYALLNHSGDFKAAAEALRAQGYGDNETDETDEFPIYTISQFRNRPRPKWQIQGVVLERSLAAIVGDFGSFKSFVSLDMALCIASGHDWMGRKTVAGPVAYIVGEGDGRFIDRIDAWLTYHGIDDVPDFRLIPVPVQMLDPKQVERLSTTLDRHNVRGGMVILDTLARTFGSGNENSQEDMNAYVAAADRIRAETEATVFINHHTNRQGEYRGSNVLPGALDTMLTTELTAEGVAVGCEKQKDGERFKPIRLRKEIVSLDDTDLGDLTDETEIDLEPRTSLVFILDDTAAESGPISVLTDKERAALRALRLANDTDGPVSTSRWLKSSGISESTFYRLRAALIHQGFAETIQRGKGAFNAITEGGRAALEPKANPFETEGTYAAD